ncbi:4'-phosphopantetheinyl transferase family protein [Chondrinema litorale]|uniref:4'-phosphopantetheinyl transferase family protein n=1 Tax=Chondrinema litorale TaxID=2994555 RepID=UPI00254352E9|nr:4'-phosphopantetheinyl transferase superfamily protein [Chondrinema litorale]UZR94209.1 4'-phosphopantetheinyl transferase superfamily protein [Chondrinema litorale]
MPIIQKQQVNDYLSLAIWKIDEQENQLTALTRDEFLPDEISSMKSPLKRCQTLAGRLIVNYLTEDANCRYSGVDKDENGKPYLVGLNSHISISHTLDMAVATFNSLCKTGVDAEVISNRILKVAPRVLSQKELNCIGNNEEEATIYWCAKEALYKLNGEKGLTFTNDLYVEKKLGVNDFSGYIISQNFTYKVDLHCFKIEQVVFVYSSEVKKLENCIEIGVENQYTNSTSN